jgi:hypothetical protein
MPRQPVLAAGAATRAPSPSPLPPQRYRALRAHYNALLVTLYERTSLTLREIAALAGRTDRAVQIMVRALGCRPRNARTCRPGTDVGPRRPGPRPPPLNAPATRRAIEAFTGVARELAASAQARAASEVQRAVARAERRTARTQARVIAGAARSLRHVAATMEDAAALRQAITDGRPRTQRPKAANKAAKRRSREEAWLTQERAMRATEARMHEAHEAARRKAAADAAAPPESEADRRINAVAERYGAERFGAGFRPQPRIRRL